MGSLLLTHDSESHPNLANLRRFVQSHWQETVVRALLPTIFQAPVWMWGVLLGSGSQRLKLRIIIKILLDRGSKARSSPGYTQPACAVSRVWPLLISSTPPLTGTCRHRPRSHGQTPGSYSGAYPPFHMKNASLSWVPQWGRPPQSRESLKNSIVL